jgi:hypothetical protein
MIRTSCWGSPGGQREKRVEISATKFPLYLVHEKFNVLNEYILQYCDSSLSLSFLSYSSFVLKKSHDVRVRHSIVPQSELTLT